MSSKRANIFLSEKILFDINTFVEAICKVKCSQNYLLLSNLLKKIG